MSEIEVTVVCTAYNQDKYIRKMLDGLVMQKTDFPVEFLVHDDASSDHTAEIIQQYAEKYPDRIIPLLEKENQFRKGNNILLNKMIHAARGKYLAFCEGDDYWTDPEKLQRQYEAMETHPECSICVHRVQGINENGEKKLRTFPMREQREGIQDTEQLMHRLIGGHEWIFHTTSYFIRTEIVKRAVDEKTDFFVNAVYPDQGLILISACAGQFYYIDSIMSVYRMGAIGGITNPNVGRKKEVERRRRKSERGIRSMTAFDQVTEFRYHSDIQNYLGYLKFQLAECDGKYRFLLSREMKPYFRQAPAQLKMRIVISSIFPFFDTMYFGLRKIVKEKRY